MKNTLIIYHSNYGQTRKIAKRMSDVLTSQGHEVEMVHVERADEIQTLEPYEVVLLGAPIYVTAHSKQLAKFIRKFKGYLDSKLTGFFSVSLSASGTEDQRAEATKCMDKFLGGLQFEPTVKTILAGSVVYREYNWCIRWIMKRIVRKSGGDTDTSKNHEYTDWNQVDEFALKFVERDQEEKPATDAGVVSSSFLAERPPVW